MRDFSLTYCAAHIFSGGKQLRAGALAVSALNIPRETIALLERLYGERSDPSTAAHLVESVCALECAAMCADGQPVSAQQAGDMIDDLIAFRVYCRHFLVKFCVGQKTASEALSLFQDSLPALTAQLRRDSNLRRTVPPSQLAPTVAFCVIGMSVARKVSFATLGELLLYDLLYSLEYNCAPHRCPSCGRFFSPEKSNLVYCDGPAPQGGGKTCRELGAGRQHAKRVASDEFAHMWKAACGRIYTRKSRRRIDAHEAQTMLDRCSRLLEQARMGELDAVTLERLLREVTDAHSKDKPDDRSPQVSHKSG